MMIFYILKTKSTSDHYEIMKVKSRCKGHFYLQNIFNFELQFFVVSVSVVLEGNSIDDVCSLFELFCSSHLHEKEVSFKQKLSILLV